LFTLSNARIRRGPQVLLDEATVTLFRGEKVGIVGRNGCGKSTLLALIRGEIATDAGEYRAPAGLTIASVAQDLPDSPRALIDYIQDGDEELRAVEAQLAAAHARNDGTLQATLHARYESLDGYRAASRAAQLARGLGFDSGDLQRGLREFSGGLRMRANLARALMRRPPFAGRVPVFIGDDVTDESVFAVLPELGGKGFSVGRHFDGMAGIFDSPEDVRRALQRLAAGRARA